MRTITGRVISTKMTATAVVEIERFITHRIYGKKMRRTTRLKVDTSGIKPKEGDLVKIIETRPMSKDKHFRVAEIIKNIK